MGAVSVDINASERKLEVMFPMHTAEGVSTFLEQKPYLESLLYYAGDFDALIMLIDFETALENANLTETERIVIDHVFIQDMKRVDVAKMMDVTKQTIQKQLERGLKKIAKYYEDIEGETNDI